MENVKEQKFELQNLKAENMVELSAWEQKQNEILAANPYIEVIDAKTYKEAKSRRTALKTGRTSVEKQDKTIATFVKGLRTAIMAKRDLLINITQPAEVKQQETIDAWETKIKEKAEAQERLNQARIENIKSKIAVIETLINDHIDLMVFGTIEDSSNLISDEITAAKDGNDFEEYDILFTDMVASKNERLAEKIITLTNQEAERVERLKLEQQSKIDQLQIEANNLINVATVFEIDGFVEKIKSVVKSEYDFGELNASYVGMKNQTIINAKIKVNALIKEKEQTDELAELRAKNAKAERKEEQLTRIGQVKEGLLDLVHQLKTTNYIFNKPGIISQLDQPATNYDLTTAEFEKMAQQIEAALDNKCVALAQEAKENKAAAVKLIEEHEKAIGLRVDLIKELGFIEEDGVFKGFGCVVEDNVLFKLEPEDFDAYIEITKGKIEAFKAADIAHQERIERLKGDKETLVFDLSQMIQFRNPNQHPLKNVEAVELYEQITENLKAWKDEQLKLINNL